MPSAKGGQIIMRTIYSKKGDCTIHIADFEAVTVKDLKKKWERQEPDRAPFVAYIFRYFDGRKSIYLENHKLLSDYNISNGALIVAKLDSFYNWHVVIKIDNDDYLDGFHEGTFWHRRETIGSVKRKIYNHADITTQHGYDTFWNKYGLSQDGKEWDNDETRLCRICNNWIWTLHLTTKVDKIYYLDHPRKIQIHDRNCLLLTIGFPKESERKHRLNIPLAINAVIKKYLNENDTHF